MLNVQHRLIANDSRKSIISYLKIEVNLSLSVDMIFLSLMVLVIPNSWIGFFFCLYYCLLSFVQEPSVAILNDAIREALNILIGTEFINHGIDSFSFIFFFYQHVLPWWISKIFHCLLTDVRNRPVLIHCKQGKVNSPNSAITCASFPI